MSLSETTTHNHPLFFIETEKLKAGLSFYSLSFSLIQFKVVPLDRPYKGHQSLVFDFLTSVSKRLQIIVWIESCLLLAGTLLFDEKIHQNADLFWFGLRDVGILYSRALIQRTIDVSPAFLECGSAEKIPVWAHANRDSN